MGKRAILIDDMIDTAGTLSKGAQAIQKHGAESVFAVATHAVPSAIDRIEASVFDKVLIQIPSSHGAAECDKPVLRALASSQRRFADSL